MILFLINNQLQILILSEYSIEHSCKEALIDQTKQTGEDGTFNNNIILSYE